MFIATVQSYPKYGTTKNQKTSDIKINFKELPLILNQENAPIKNYNTLSEDFCLNIRNNLFVPYNNAIRERNLPFGNKIINEKKTSVKQLQSLTKFHKELNPDNHCMIEIKKNKNLSNCDFSKMSFKYNNLSDISFTSSSFEKAGLKHVDFLNPEFNSKTILPNGELATKNTILKSAADNLCRQQNLVRNSSQNYEVLLPPLALPPHQPTQNQQAQHTQSNRQILSVPNLSVSKTTTTPPAAESSQMNLLKTDTDTINKIGKINSDVVKPAENVKPLTGNIKIKNTPYTPSNPDIDADLLNAIALRNFIVSDKIKLMNLASNDTEKKVLTTLISDKRIDYKGDIVPRFACDKIKDLFALYKEVSHYQGGTEYFNLMVSENKRNDKGMLAPRFYSWDIQELFPLYKEAPEYFKMLIIKTTVDDNGYIVPMFSSDNIKELFMLYKEVAHYKDGHDYFSIIFNETTINSKGNVVPRFSSNNIKELFPFYKVNPELFITLLNCKIKNSDDNLVPLLSYSMLKKLLTSYNPQFEQDILNRIKQLDIILNNKDDFLKYVKCKCNTTCPEMLTQVEHILYDPNFLSKIMLLPNLSQNNLCNYFSDVAKIISRVKKSPEKLLSGVCSEKIINAFNSKTQFDIDTFSNQEVQIYNEIKRFIEKLLTPESILKFLQVIATTDIELVQQYLDRGLNNFDEFVYEIIELDFVSKNIVSNLITNGKRINKKGIPGKLSGRQKKEVLNIVESIKNLQSSGIKFDIEKYKLPIQNTKNQFVVDFENLRKDLFNCILQKNDLTQDEIQQIKPENLNWDIEYIHLLAHTPELDNGELAIVIKEASKGTFKQYINSNSNIHGQANLETEKMFDENNLDYKNWQTGPKEQKITIQGNEYTIKLWNRIPQESLFDGTYTSCCTALNGCNGAAMANYMLNTAINVVEVKDSNGKIIAMSRCFIAESEGVNSLIIENIERNNAFGKYLTEKDKSILVQGISQYMKDFAELVGGKNMPVYLSTSYNHLGYNYPNTICTKLIKILGKISKNKIYINSFSTQIDANNFVGKADFYLIKKPNYTDNTDPSGTVSTK